MKKSGFRNYILLFVATLSISYLSVMTAQNQSDTFASHLRFGGGIGLSFGSDFFSGSISPNVLYQFNSSFGLGLGLNGAYSSLNNQYSATIIGGSVLALYNVIPEIQLSAEFEESNISKKYTFPEGNYKENYWYPAMFMGVGFHTHNVIVGIRYDLLFDRDKSIYAEAYAPFVRVYF